MFDLAASYSKGVKSVSLRVFFPTWRWGELFRSLSVALREPMEAWYADHVAFAFLAPMAPSERQGVFAPRRISPGLWLFRPCIRHFDNHLREQARKGFYLIQGKSADSYEGEAPDDRMRHGRPHRTPRRLDPGPARPQWLRDTVPQGVHIVLSAPRMTGRSL